MKSNLIISAQETTGIAQITAAEKFERYVDLAKSALADNTKKAYNSDWNQLGQWLKAKSVGFPMTEQAVIEFINYLASQGNASATIKRKISSISVLHKANGYVDGANPVSSSNVDLSLKGISKRLGTYQTQAAAMRLKHLELLDYHFSHVGLDLIAVRDLLIINMAFDGLLRRSEIINVTVADISHAETGNGGKLFIPKSKSDQTGEGAYVWLGSNTMHYYQKWREMTGIDSGILFRKINKWGKVATLSKQEQELSEEEQAKKLTLSTVTINRVFRKMGAILAKTNKADAFDWSGHSGRVGAAIDLAKNGASLVELQLAGRWKSPIMPAKYTRMMEVEQSAMSKLRP